jgi:diguanylate cyclase (GGDEF)-like protein/PAS domain S-box-containing protein
MAVYQGALPSDGALFSGSGEDPTPALVAHSTRFVPSPVVAGAALIALLVLLSWVDTITHLPAWSATILLVAGLAALAGTIHGARLAETELDRLMRATLAGVAFFYTTGRLVHLVGVLSNIPIPTVYDAVPLGGLVALVFACWWVGLRTRFSRSEQVAIALDSAVVFFTAGATSLVVLGGSVGSSVSPLALGYTVVFAGALGATVVLNLAITTRRGPYGWVVLVIGIVPLVGGSAWEVLAPVGTWAPYAACQALGVLLCAYGCATWTGELDPSESFRRWAVRVRGWLPLAATAVAPIVIVANALLLTPRAPALGVAADAMLAVVLMLCVLRQTTLLRERDRSTKAVNEAENRESALLDDLRVSEQRFRSLVSNSSDVFLIIGPDGTVEYQSPAVERVLGYAADDRLGRQIFELTHPDDIGFVQTTIAELIATPGGQRTIELRSRHADGSWRVIEATGHNLAHDPAVRGIVVNYRDITERKRLEEQLTHQAFHDPLTNLANRALFADRVEHALHRSGEGRQLAVLFMDLDDFKTINDSLGHVAGDLVLTAVSERLRSSLRPEDTVARLGGDEFAVLLEETDVGGARDTADRLLGTLRLPFEVAGKQVHIGASVGVAMGADSADVDEVLRNADVAMYTAKNRGKSRVEMFESSMHAAVVTRLELRADLEHALERGEFRLRYQPLYDLTDGRLHSFEALLRWRHPIRGDVMPQDFIPLAEETGLIVPIGRWILDQTCRQAQAWREGGRPELMVSFNMSSRQLREPTLVPWIAEALATSGLPPGNLIVELTESGIMQDDEGRLQQLRNLGVSLALDDFGTGYSSLSYLSRFPIDILKIDRSFIASLGVEDEESALVQSVVQLASSMKLQTVAEGIETPAQLARVRALGCDFGQGYWLAKPMDAIRATTLVRDGSSIVWEAVGESEASAG